jgi:hypothetical protein
MFIFFWRPLLNARVFSFICDFGIGPEALKKCHSGSFFHAFALKKWRGVSFFNAIIKFFIHKL